MTDKNLTDWSPKECPKPQIEIDSELETKFEKVVESARAEYRIIQREIHEAQTEYHAKIQEFSKPYRAKLDELAKELS